METETTENKTIICKNCGHEHDEDNKFCPKCGAMTQDADPKVLLGVEITDDDILSYITRGFIEKEIKIGAIGDQPINIKIKTLTQDDHVKINKAVDRMVNPSSLNGTLDECRNAEFLKRITTAIAGKTYYDEEKDKVLLAMPKQLANIILFKHSHLEMLVLQMLQRGQYENF